MKKVAKFLFMLIIVSITVLFNTACTPDDLFCPYYPNEKLQIVYSIDATVYTFENKATFIIPHNGNNSDSETKVSESQDELYISSTEVDSIIYDGTRMLWGDFDRFAYNNNYAYVKKGNMYHVVDVTGELDFEYTEDEFFERYPDYQNLNWYNV